MPGYSDTGERSSPTVSPANSAAGHCFRDIQQKADGSASKGRRSGVGWGEGGGKGCRQTHQQWEEIRARGQGLILGTWSQKRANQDSGR